MKNKLFWAVIIIFFSCESEHKEKEKIAKETIIDTLAHVKKSIADSLVNIELTITRSTEVTEDKPFPDPLFLQKIKQKEEELFNFKKELEIIALTLDNREKELNARENKLSSKELEIRVQLDSIKETKQNIFQKNVTPEPSEQEIDLLEAQRNDFGEQMKFFEEKKKMFEQEQAQFLKVKEEFNSRLRQFEETQSADKTIAAAGEEGEEVVEGAVGEEREDVVEGAAGEEREKVAEAEEKTAEEKIELPEAEKKWVIYNTTNSGLPDNYIRAITIDGKGNKWIGTSRGLVQFDGKDFTVYNTLNCELPDEYVNAIAIDKSEKVWIATDDGIARFDPDGEIEKMWTIYQKSNPSAQDYVYNPVKSVTIDEKGIKWFGSEAGLMKFVQGDSEGSPDKWKIYNTSNSSIPDDEIGSVTIDKQGLKWIGTYYGGLASFDEVKCTVYNQENSGLPTQGGVGIIAIDTIGNKWVATGNGLVKLKADGQPGEKCIVYNKLNSGLPINSIGALAFDKGGNLWIGTWGGGLVKYDGTNWKVYDQSNSQLPHNKIWSILIDENDYKWIGTLSGGLAVFK
ncbi:MAG: hypothetical protein FVQ77_07420 [Cytophagales bacterium]|nr:hypothetical protein [Cytophagales bacterium]